MLSSGPFRPAAELAALYQGRDLWLVPGIIPMTGVVILASAPKTGKTCFATALARAVAKGEPFLGEPVKQHPVLWCAHEETPPERTLLHEGLSLEDPFLIAYPAELPALALRMPRTDHYGRRDLTCCDPPFIFEHAAAVGARLIVIDCLHAAVEGANLADNCIARAIMGVLRTWSSHCHIAVLILHHLTKSSTRGHQPERFADSAQILAASSCHFFMDRQEESAACSRIVLHGKGRHPAPVARLELISEGILDYRVADVERQWVPPRRIAAPERILHLLEEGWSLTAKELSARLNLTPGLVRSALADLASSGRVVGEKRPKQNLRYSISTSTERVA